MKQFIVEVPEGITRCKDCPFDLKDNVCLYLSENNHCEKYDFSELHVKEIENERH